MITLQQKIDAVGRLIEDLRWARADPTAPEHETYNALKALASDLAARQQGKPEETRRLIGREIAMAVRSRTALGYNLGNLRAVAEVTIGKWPVIEQALERFERELEGTAR